MYVFYAKFNMMSVKMMNVSIVSENSCNASPQIRTRTYSIVIKLVLLIICCNEENLFRFLLKESVECVSFTSVGS